MKHFIQNNIFSMLQKICTLNNKIGIIHEVVNRNMCYFLLNYIESNRSYHQLKKTRKIILALMG